MNPKNPIPKPLLDRLVCLGCKASLTCNKDQTSLFCAKCNASYPIRQGIPCLLKETI